MYTKYHGCGNDFIIGPYKDGINYSELAKKVCNRFTGIGADGFLLAKEENGRIEMVFYNADGSRAPMCGNGIRCFSLYCLDKGLVNGDIFSIDTLSGEMLVEVKQREPYICKVCLGEPIFSSKKLDIDTKEETFLDQELNLEKYGKVNVSAVYMATHHLVVLVDDLDEAINSTLAYELGSNKVFTKGINVNLVQIIDRDNIKMKTFERGAGWTCACGTGASASYVIMRLKDLCNEKVKIHLQYGQIEVSSIENKIYMEGPSVCIASNIDIK